MYAIVEIGGHQYKVEESKYLYVNRLEGDEGSEMSFDSVLLLRGDSEIKVGRPLVDGCTVKAEIVKHLRDDKVLVFKKKRRKGYQVKRGHRQDLTQIKINKIAS